MKEELNRRGIDFFDVGNGLLEVQCIDFPRDWEEEYGYDFTIPTLNSDEEAKKIAIEMGFSFIEGTTICLDSPY